MLRRVRRERRPVGRRDSKLWRRQQSGANSDTKWGREKRPSQAGPSVETGQEEVGQAGQEGQEGQESQVSLIIKKILRQQTALRTHIRRLEEGGGAGTDYAGTRGAGAGLQQEQDQNSNGKER